MAEYGLTVATAIAYGMNSEFSQVLALEMRRFNEEGNSSIMHQVHGQIDELKNIMVRNIENVSARGERIELLVNKTENLRNSVSGAGWIKFCFSPGKPDNVIDPLWVPSLAVGLLSTDVAERSPNDVLEERENVCDPGGHPAVRRLRHY